MRLVRIELANWRCFRGAHAVGLGPGAHAVVARHERDAERSNWLGKSSLLQAVLFALTGDRPDDCRYEDDWISRGEAEGSVAVVFDDGTRVSRSRRRGGPTVLETLAPGDDKPARQAEGQAKVDRLLGLLPSDAPSWFFAQKAMDRLVRMKPQKRAAEVAEWLRLGPLVAAEEGARRRLREAVQREARLSVEERADGDALVRLVVDRDPKPENVAGTVELLAAEEAESARAEEAAGADVARLEEEQTLRVTALAAEERRFELAELEREAEEAVERARAAEALAPSRPRLGRLRSAADDAVAAWREATKSTLDRLALARGEFDGTCPVGGIVCPVRAELNAQKEENRRAAEEARGRAMAAHRASEKAKRERDGAEALLRAAETARAEASALAARLVRARERNAVSNKPAKCEEAGAASMRRDVEGELRAVREAWRAAWERARDARAAAAEARRLAARIEARRKELEFARSTVATAREAAAVLRVSRRRIAEGATEEIQDEANALLARAGVELSVRIAWEREASGLAAACDACGAAYPASTRVRSCSGCGAQRGPKVEERLDVELSDRSGAAEDLAGVAISLAASARLRRERGSAWGLVCMDEPFGALDRAHRRALSRGLVAMLRGQWEQALVIAHDDAAMEGMPGRIIIVGGEGGSRILAE